MKRVGAIVVPEGTVESQIMLQWLSVRIDYEFDVEMSRAFGVERDGKMACVWAYSSFRKPDISLSIASDNPRWCTRQVLAALLGYPFLQLGAGRITALAHAKNKRSRRLIEGVGFKREGTLRKASKDGRHLIIYGLLREEYDARWGKRTEALAEAA